MSGKNLLTLREVSERLSCSRAHLNRLISNRKIRVINIGQRKKHRELRIDEADLQSFVDGRAIDPVDGSPPRKKFKTGNWFESGSDGVARLRRELVTQSIKEGIRK